MGSWGWESARVNPKRWYLVNYSGIALKSRRISLTFECLIRVGSDYFQGQQFYLIFKIFLQVTRLPNSTVSKHQAPCAKSYWICVSRVLNLQLAICSFQQVVISVQCASSADMIKLSVGCCFEVFAARLSADKQCTYVSYLEAALKPKLYSIQHPPYTDSP